MKKIRSIAFCSFVLSIFCAFAHAQDAEQLTDPQIASAAVTANRIDMDYGKIALQRSRNPEIRKFAQTMINDHHAIIDQAVALAKKLNVTPEDNPLTQQLLKGKEETVKMLRSKKGKAFDHAYMDNEVAYHTAVIEAVETNLIPQSTHPELKALLMKAVPLLKEHLEHARMVQAQMK